MTTIRYEISDKGFRIEASGHANFNEPGKDIVCAGISMLIQTLIAHTECFAHIKDGYVYCMGNEPEYAEFVITGLRLLESNYSEFVKVVQGCPMNYDFNLE